MHKKGAYVVKKDDPIVLEGNCAASVNLLLQGRLDAYISSFSENLPDTFDLLKQRSYKLFSLEQNIFIGVNDILRGGISTMTLAASCDSSLYGYDADSTQSLLSVIHSQKDYGAYVIGSLCGLITSSLKTLERAGSYNRKLLNIINNLTAFYLTISKEYELSNVPEVFAGYESVLDAIKDNNILIPNYFDEQFLESEIPYGPDKEELLFAQTEKKAEYFTHIGNLSSELLKSFFGADHLISDYHIKSASECLDTILDRLRRAFSLIEQRINHLYSNTSDNAYSSFINAAKEMKEKGHDCSGAIKASAYILEKLEAISNEIEDEFAHKTGLDFEYIKHSHSNIVSSFNAQQLNSDPSCISVDSTLQKLPDELVDSAAKILKYSEISDEKSVSFMMKLVAFRNLRDKLANDDTARNIRNGLAEPFFDIYAAVFKKAYKLKDKSRLIKMFLSYGYMDEKLLETDQVLELFKLAGTENPYPGSNVYYTDEWLTKIALMERDPSINQYGQDYLDIFRDMKRHGKVTDKDKDAYIRDVDSRVEFEIGNMLRINYKLCYGQLSTFSPILHKDVVQQNLSRSHVTPAIIREKLEKILEIDYSAFHREVNFRAPEKGIEKETVMMRVLPDIILIPVHGSRAMMWQEISGRYRNTPARFLVPVFTDCDIEQMLIELTGQFRWELCRTMMGSAWNDVTVSSLTSEYTDYTQFYKKNRDLSDEAKEKIKSQIKKYNNRMRDIFTADYEQWIRFESKGSPRLNKVARGILFRYCPFSKSIRDQLEKQPIYADLVSSMKFQKAKHARDLENRYKHYLKLYDGKLDEDLVNNLTFYRDL